VVTAFKDASLLGYQSSDWTKQALVWLTCVAIADPINVGARKLWGRVINDSPKGFIAGNMFKGETRHGFFMGGSGHGKSSLIKEAMADQMSDVMKGKMSMFVMDGTELIPEILTKVNPTDRQIRERVVLIDVLEAGGVGDIGSMPRLNMLNTGAGDSNSFIAMTAKASIFEMVFGSLLEGNEQSGPMSTMLSFASKTLAYVENPSPDDFINLLRDPFTFMEGVKGIPKLVKEYWQDEIKVKPIKDGREIIGHEVMPNPTSGALQRRAYQMISNPIIERLLCNPLETVNLAQKLNDGAFVAVATRSGAATAVGSRHIGRFMLSMLLRATKARDSLGAALPVAAYIDEFPNYLLGGKDESLIGLLSEARKFRISINLICQEEGQTAPAMLSSLIANCATFGSRNMAERLRFPMKIEQVESGPNKGKPNIDILKLNPHNFAACVKGHQPVVIKSKKDALGDRFRRIPKGKKGKKMLEDTMTRVNGIMRELYAYDPIEQQIDESDNVERFEEAQPI